PRTAPPRHQTLRATLDWSYALLPESEKVVFRRLAIFAGSFSLKAAGVVAADPEIGRSDVVRCVANLATKSLVTVDVGNATEHYGLLETTQGYGLEKLTEGSASLCVGSIAPHHPWPNRRTQDI